MEVKLDTDHKIKWFKKISNGGKILSILCTEKVFVIYRDTGTIIIIRRRIIWKIFLLLSLFSLNKFKMYPMSSVYVFIVSSSQFAWTSDFMGLKWICSLGMKKLARISMTIKIHAMVAVIYASSFIADITSMKWLIPWRRNPQRRILKKYVLNII